jgi:uncharacterized membrane protein YphA (DoxX/SURF4 family)
VAQRVDEHVTVGAREDRARKRAEAAAMDQRAQSESTAGVYAPGQDTGAAGRWLASVLRALGLAGEDPTRVSRVATSSFDRLRIVFGLVLLYDSWTSLSWVHKTEMGHFLGLPLHSGWLHLTIAAIAFVKLALAAALIAGRGVSVMGWVGVVYGLVVWLAVEHGGDFGQDATDPGLGLPYIVVFLYVLGADRLHRHPNVSDNELLALARVAFGLLWGYDALLKFQPYFLTHYLDYLTTAQRDMAGTWAGTYDQAWIGVSRAIGPEVVAVAVALTETAVAVSLLSGRGLRLFAPVGLVLAFVIWSTAEEWGGPYSTGVGSMPMNLLGTAIIYVIGLSYVCALYNPRDLFRSTS